MALEKLVVMVKAPRPGTVKTRLARALGPEAACQAYAELVDCLLKNLANLTGVELRYAPDDAEPEIREWLSPGWVAVPQGKGDLGPRLRHVIAESFAKGPMRLVIVGSDCPWVTEKDIREAWRRLVDHDVVLGPAHDGGYWLLGLNRPQPGLLRDIAWSSEAVFQQTMDRAQDLGLNVHCLRQLSDVDEAVDWEKFKAQME